MAVRFSFGKNWRQFLETVGDDQLQHARRSLADFFGLPDFRGKTFVDIGSGSGIFSYAAFVLGAERVVSFDYDPFSVACTEAMRLKAGSPERWQVFQGSILDKTQMDGLGQFDLVHAWGVLHHTGDLWRALRHSADLVAPGGLFYLALYNKVPGVFGSRSWKHVVAWYNASPPLGKWLMEETYILNFIIRNLVRLKNPWKQMQKHRAKRGMDWRLDVKDDLGGHPYDYASVEEVFNFMKKNFPGFELMKLRTTTDRGNNKFLFQRR